MANESTKMFYGKAKNSTPISKDKGNGRVCKPSIKQKRSNLMHTSSMYTTSPNQNSKLKLRDVISKATPKSVPSSSQNPDYTSSQSDISFESHQDYSSSLLNNSLDGDDDNSGIEKSSEALKKNQESFSQLLTDLREDLRSYIENECGKVLGTMEDGMKNLKQKMATIKTAQQEMINLLKHFTSKEKLNIPLELKRKIKRFYKQLPEEEQWDLEEVFTSDLNEQLTAQFIDDVKVNLDEYSHEQIRGACKIYFTNLKKEEKSKEDVERYEQQKLEKKYRIRRERLLETRSKFIQGTEEKSLWDGVTSELMSDEEDGGDVFKVKSPHWRSDALTELVRTLDKRKKKSDEDNQKLIAKVKRVDSSSPMKRKPSKKVKSRFLKNDTEQSAASDDSGELTL